MANESKKDFNAMLHDSKDMPKIQTVTDPKTIENTAAHECILRRRLTMIKSCGGFRMVKWSR